MSDAGFALDFEVAERVRMVADDFLGAKLAYLYQGQLLVYRRDDKPEIPFPGLWDFPGGGREADESAEMCVLRELFEEFGIAMDEARLVYKKRVPSQLGDGVAYFFVALGRQEEVDGIVFGDEGQYWQWMSIADFLAHPEVIDSLKGRLQGYLDGVNPP